MREIHGVQHRGWIKVQIVLEAETRKPVAFEITDERITDQKMVGSLLKDVKPKDALMDAAYDFKSFSPIVSSSKELSDLIGYR